MPFENVLSFTKSAGFVSPKSLEPGTKITGFLMRTFDLKGGKYPGKGHEIELNEPGNFTLAVRENKDAPVVEETRNVNAGELIVLNGSNQLNALLSMINPGTLIQLTFKGKEDFNGNQTYTYEVAQDRDKVKHVPERSEVQDEDSGSETGGTPVAASGSPF